MRANRIIFLVTIMFIAGAIAGAICSSASAKEITVGDDSEADFISIQEAVNNSSSGDVVLVLPGIYNESVSVRTEGLSILSKSGNPEDTVIQAFNLSANNTVVNGFSIYENVSMRPVYASGQRSIENCTLRNNLFLEP
jgi:pectin methylesterase-like acyl-CoA thioesterase